MIKKILLIGALCMIAITTPAMSLFVKHDIVNVTNQTFIPVFMTNAAGQKVVSGSNEVDQIVAKDVPGTYALKSGTQTVISGASVASDLLPPPYGSILAVIGLGLSGILGGYVKRKNAQLGSTQIALGTTTDMLNATIQGVEAVGSALTKQSIASHAAAAGVADELHQTVQDMTNSSAPATSGTFAKTPPPVG